MRRTTTLVLALGAVGLAACGGADSSPHAAAGTHASAPGPSTTTVPVPWAALRPTHPDIPSTRVRPRPDPAIAEAARTCGAGDLILHALGNGAAMGTTVDNLRFALAPGHRPCAVSGRPVVSVRTVEGTVVHGHPSRFTSTYHRPVLLTPTADALAQLLWPSACFAASGQASAQVTYADRTWVVSVGPLSGTCHLEPDRPLRDVGVTRFLPPDRRRSHRVTAYNDVRVHGPVHVAAHLDGVVTFPITLVAQHDVTLDPCPDYWFGSGDSKDAAHALNCAAVPFRDGQGRPYLPAHRRVQFEMRMCVVEPLQKYVWSIVAPGPGPSAGGVVVVR